MGELRAEMILPIAFDKDNSKEKRYLRQESLGKYGLQEAPQ